jgi:Protein of unknown function (DUF2971)
VPSRNTPNVLYKYVSPERVDVLLQKQVRFTQPCFLNDPFEFRPGMPAEAIGQFERTVAGWREKAYREKSRKYGVLSLTPKNNSIPMWTHYAASHTGLAIGFDTSSSLFQQAVTHRKLRPVQYDEERVSITRGLENRDGVNPDTIFLTRSKEWKYEQEWRWLECCDPYDYADVVPGPNGEFLFLRHISPESIRQIVLGYRASYALSESIQMLKLTKVYRHLEIFKVTLSKTHYALAVEPI